MPARTSPRWAAEAPADDGDGAAAEALADVIIGVAEKFEAQAGDQEGSEALSGGAAEFALDGFAGEAVEIGAAENVAAEMRADAAVGVADGQKLLERGGLVAIHAADEFAANIERAFGEINFDGGADRGAMRMKLRRDGFDGLEQRAERAGRPFVARAQF